MAGMIGGVGGGGERAYGPLNLTAACLEAEETMTQDVTRACHLALWEKWNTKPDSSAKPTSNRCLSAIAPTRQV